MKNITSMKLKRLALYLLILILPALFLPVNCGKERVPEKKQIILISIDTLRGDHLNSYGYFRETAPNLFKLIKDSIYYREAYPNGCWTMPSHMSLLTGTLPSRHGINKDWQSTRDRKYPKLNRSLKSMPEILRTQDIATLKFAKLPPRLGFSRGYDKDTRKDPFSTNRKFYKILQELEKHKEKDFFFFIHTWMVHAPYSNCYYLKKGLIDQEMRYYINNYRVLEKKTNFIGRDFHRFLIENKLCNVKNCVDLYDGGIRYVDRYIGRLIEECKRLGIYDDMMLIIVSDHGEHFAEHYPGRFYS
ncbi:sulfatase [Acidobacteriota bacterium]